MAERLKAHAWKVCRGLKPLASSNLAPSAIKNAPDRGLFLCKKPFRYFQISANNAFVQNADITQIRRVFCVFFNRRDALAPFKRLQRKKRYCLSVSASRSADSRFAKAKACLKRAAQATVVFSLFLTISHFKTFRG